MKIVESTIFNLGMHPLSGGLVHDIWVRTPTSLSLGGGVVCHTHYQTNAPLYVLSPFLATGRFMIVLQDCFQVSHVMDSPSKTTVWTSLKVLY